MLSEKEIVDRIETCYKLRMERKTSETKAILEGMIQAFNEVLKG